MTPTRTRYFAILQKMSISLIIGLIIWMILLVRGAQAAKQNPPGAFYAVTAGPLVLHKIQREAEPNTTKTLAAISFEKDLLAYAAVWIFLSIGWSMIVIRSKHKLYRT